MTNHGPDWPASRAKFERERQARIAAETLLEAKARELFDANQELLNEREALRDALTEIEIARERERNFLKDQSILFQSLSAVSGKAELEEATYSLIETLQAGFEGCDVCLLQEDGGQSRVLASSARDLVGLPLQVSLETLRTARIVGDIKELTGAVSLPALHEDVRSGMMAPLDDMADRAFALLLVSYHAEEFLEDDLRVLRRVGKMVGPVLNSMQIARRNQFLVSLLEGQSGSDQMAEGRGTPSSENAGFKFLSDLQGGIARVLEGLAGSPVEGLAAVLEDAMNTMFKVMQAHRAFVFERSTKGEWLRNTQVLKNGKDLGSEGKLQDVAVAAALEWQEDFDAGRKTYLQTQSSETVELTMVPHLVDGRIQGAIGFENLAARSPEVTIVRTVAKVVTTLLALRDQTAQIRRLSEIARRTSNFVVITDPACRITWVNEALVEASGWALDDLKGLEFSRFLFPNAVDLSKAEAFERSLSSGNDVDIEIPSQTRYGDEYFVNFDIQKLRNHAGHVEGYMAVGRDVTRRRLQSDALLAMAEEAEKSRSTLQAAVEALQDGFVLYDADDRLVICNQRFREIYAKSAPAMTPGTTFESILRYGLERGEYKDAIGREEDWLKERLAAHFKQDSEVEQELSDGRWLRIFEKQTPDGGRVGLRVDITASKLAEKRALADRSAAMEASHDGIAITDTEGNFLYVNRACLDLFGYASEAQVVGKHWTLFFIGDASVRLREVALPAVEEAGNWTGEVFGQSKQGAPLDQDVSLTQNGDRGILWIMRDMRARRREMAERERLRDELQLAQRREVVAQMASGLAHDFNNLLATISGGAQLIREDAKPRSLAATGAMRIQSATDKATDLVNRLLSLGRPETVADLVDLRKPITEAADLVRVGVSSSKRVDVHLPDAPVEVRADVTDVLQMILNLGINASDAIGDRSGQITITLEPASDEPPDGPFMIGRAKPDQRYCCIVVEDTGPGMSSNFIARAFEPYHTTKGEKGNGLGLAIVSSVVERAGGVLRLDTAPGQGCRFVIYWPEGMSNDASDPALAPSLTGRLDGRTILVVDDQEELLSILTAFLESVGAEVAATTEPLDAIEAIRDDPEGWDLLMTDFEMPDMTGLDLSRTVRPLAPQMPILLVTALVGLSERYPDDFNGFLRKPLDKDTVVRMAETVIQAAQERTK